MNWITNYEFEVWWFGTPTIILIILLLQGCIYQMADQEDIRKAQEYCADKGGIYELHIEFNSAEVVYCKDTTSGYQLK